MTSIHKAGFVSVKGARQHNLKNIDVEIPRDALVVFTGVSGSGKSSLAFGTLYAEAQRRYLESVAPYARRLFDQMGVPEVDSIDGLPPAVALQQQRGSPTTRSSVGSVTTLSNLLRMLYSRAGSYPPHQPELHGEAFSTNSPEGACPNCHGIGRIYDATEQTMVPDASLTIRQRAIAAWPTAWGGQNQRDILVTLGYDVDRPWRDLPRKDRDWILFTEQQPTVPVYAGFTPEETRRALKRKEEPSYQGTCTGVRRYLLHTLAHTESALTRKRVLQYLVSTECPACHGKRLRPESLSVKFAGLDIAEISALPLTRLNALLGSAALASTRKNTDHPERAMVALRITEDLRERIAVMFDLGLGYLSLERSTPTLSPGELQRLRLATQIRSNLFGVVYVLDEPSAGLHPADTEALLVALDRLKASGNSLFVVEHELDVIRHADWIVDVGPAAGEHGGQILYSGPPKGLEAVPESRTRPYLFGKEKPRHRIPRAARGWLRMEGVTRNNLKNLSVAFPLGILTTVTGVSGSGKSSLVSQALVELVGEHLGHSRPADEEDANILSGDAPVPSEGRITDGLSAIKRLVQVDQKPIGRTPRSNLLSRPDQVVYFFRTVIGVPVVDKDVLSKRTNEYRNWVEAFARNHKTPMEWAEKGVRKEEYVEPFLRRMERAGQYGVYFIFQSMEQGPTFRCTVPKFPTQDPNHRIPAQQRSRFKHYYFYLRDETLGPMVMRMASFFPFQTTYYLNGHSFIEQELNRAKVGFRKNDNAFLAVDDVTALQSAADRLTGKVIGERLDYWTLLLGPKFSKRERGAMNLHRFYAVHQIEYCRNFIFKRHFPIHRIFERSCEIGLWRLTAHKISEIFGSRVTKKLKGKLNTTLEQVEHGHHIFRAYFKHAFVKQYEKFSTFLRNEICSNNLSDFKLKKGVEHLACVREKFLEITDRFATFQAQSLNVHVEFPLLQRLALPIAVGTAKFPGIKIHDTRMIRLMEVLLHEGTTVGGWTATQIHDAVLSSFGLTATRYGLNQLRYDLRKMRAHGLIERDGKRYAYRLTRKGAKVALTFVLFHQRLCGPLANSLFHHQPNAGAKPKSKLEDAYHKADASIRNVIQILEAA